MTETDKCLTGVKKQGEERNRGKDEKLCSKREPRVEQQRGMRTVFDF